jgi:nucleoside-diphosphate-sugar epimerase
MTARVSPPAPPRDAISGLADGSRICAAVTGAAGFLGSEIARQAASLGWTVKALDRTPSSRAGVVSNAVLDIRDAAAAAEHFRDCQVVVHAAGLAHHRPRSVKDYFDMNEHGAESVARAAVRAGVPRLVLVSSVAVYGGNANGPCRESDSCRPVGPYALSKWRGEQRSIEAVAGSQTSLMILRLATVYGEEDPGNLARLMRLIDRGRFIWIGPGTNFKSLVYRGDAARACLFAAAWPGPGCRLFNVSADPARILEIVAGLATALDRRTPHWRVPAALARFGAGVVFPLSGHRRVTDDITRWLADDVYPAEEIRHTLGFVPVVSLHEGLRREVAWYRSRCS